MKDIIQLSSSDGWSNNLQKRAPYTLRSALLYLEFVLIQVPSGAHILHRKLQINPDLPQKWLPKSLLARKMTSFSSLRHALQHMTHTRHLINDCPLGYFFGCHK